MARSGGEGLLSSDGDAAWSGRYRQTGASALYLHVPFCVSKCAYCDFPSWATRHGDPLMASYVETLEGQLSELRDLGLLSDVGCAYLGGGTPSLLGADLLGRLVACVWESCPDVEEFSCAANPESLSDQVLDALVASGASRVSVGVQSLCDAELRELGRVHTADQALDRLRAALGRGLDVSADLMCAIPLQTDQSWLESLDGLVRTGIGHVSVYPLTIEEGTALDRRVGDEDLAWNDPDVQASRMGMAERVLGEAGFSRYEVASYAMPGKACRHNQTYWTGQPYLGLGTGASGMLTTLGYVALGEICNQLPPAPAGTERVRLSVTSSRQEIACGRGLRDLAFDLEFLTWRQALAEDLMLGARLSAGVDAGLLALAGDAFGPALDACLGEVEGRGLARMTEEGRLAPTEKGWLLGNELYGLLWGLASDDGEVKSGRSL